VWGSLEGGPVLGVSGAFSFPDFFFCAWDLTEHAVGEHGAKGAGGMKIRGGNIFSNFIGLRPGDPQKNMDFCVPPATHRLSPNFAGGKGSFYHFGGGTGGAEGELCRGFQLLTGPFLPEKKKPLWVCGFIKRPGSKTGRGGNFPPFTRFGNPVFRASKVHPLRGDHLGHFCWCKNGPWGPFRKCPERITGQTVCHSGGAGGRKRTKGVWAAETEEKQLEVGRPPATARWRPVERTCSGNGIRRFFTEDQRWQEGGWEVVFQRKGTRPVPIGIAYFPKTTFFPGEKPSLGFTFKQNLFAAGAS